MRAAWLALLLLAPALAGCLGGEEEPVERQAAPGEDTGALEGLVTDPAVQPVAGANVTLVGAERSTETAEDGSFAFSRVAPGEHTVRVDAPGFVPVEETASVTAGEVARLDVVLADEADQAPYTQTLEMKGFIECGAGWRQDLADVGEPLLQDSAIAACAVPNLLLPGGNATNDKFLHTFQLDPPLTEVVYEMQWQAGSTEVTAPALRSILELNGFVNQDPARIMDVRGDNPLHVRLTEEDWASLEANITEQCRSDEAGDDWCSVNPRANGWDLMLRVFATGDCQDAPVGACLVVQQEFTHFVTAFYHQQAPDGYRLVEP